MTSKTVHSCPSCGSLNHSVLADSILLVCKHCGSIVYDKIPGPSKLQPSAVPPDWSFIQMGASGEYQGQRFDIVGRIRLQLRNDYKNFWCAALHDGTRLWLMESFASFAMLSGVWREYASSGSDVRAGKVINAGKGLKFTGEFVEKCESLSYEGEIGGWDLFDRYFFVVQAANKENGIALFTLVGKKTIRFLSGEKVGVEMLGLKNIVVWDEWK